MSFLKKHVKKFDLTMRAMNKEVTWYDKELGYTETLVRHVVAAGRLI